MYDFLTAKLHSPFENLLGYSWGTHLPLHALLPFGSAEYSSVSTLPIG